jgi:predicted PilT family ATPase
MEQEFDWGKVPSKVFVDSMSIRVINGLLHVAIQSGQKMMCYLLPLPLAKLIGKAITKQVEEIEKKNGIKFDDRLPDEPMLSPWTSGEEKGGNANPKK